MILSETAEVLLQCHCVQVTQHRFSERRYEILVENPRVNGTFEHRKSFVIAEQWNVRETLDEEESGSEHTHNGEILPTSINAESTADSAPKVNQVRVLPGPPRCILWMGLLGKRFLLQFHTYSCLASKLLLS